jgi:short-subunit dehydrogenase
VLRLSRTRRSDGAAAHDRLKTRVRISGKVVLITGASGGIGAACADVFERGGALLSLTARTAIDRPGALYTPGDIIDPAARIRIVEATLERYGRIDILINNAAQGSYHPAAAASQEEIRGLFELNVFAPLALAQLVIPHMRHAGSGIIVNVGSIATYVTLPWLTVYSATKSALAAVTDGLRMELKGSGVRMMSVCPGYVKTPFQSHAIGAPPQKIANAKSHAITAEQCAQAIARGVEREARTVVTPGIGWLLIWLQRLAPSMVDSRLARIVAHSAARAAANTAE